MRLAQALRRWKAPTSGGLTIGDAYGGGFYGGLINIDGLIYRLVLATKSAETISPANASRPGGAGGSRYDGALNTTQTANNAGAVYCRSYIDPLGNNDYYMASMDEWEVIQRNLKNTADLNDVGYGANPNSVPPGAAYTSTDPAQTSVPAFRAGGAQALATDTYWTSTAGPGANWMYQTYTGLQSATGGQSSFYIRPMRKVLVT
jgi:hypothetical protein